LAGSCICRIATSGAALVMLVTRDGILRIANSPAPGTVRASMITSDCGAAWQVRIQPAASSSALNALD
jgi:hypothetical protein